MGIFSDHLNQNNPDNSPAGGGNRNEPAWTRKVLPEPVYYVFSPHDDTVLVGKDVVVSRHEDGYYISWWDPAHERMMRASGVINNPDFFAFRRNEGPDDGRLYFFVPMDLDIYNRRVKMFLTAGRDFDSREDMIKAFLDAAE